MTVAAEQTAVPEVPDNSVLSNNFNFIRLCMAVLVIVGHSFEIVDGNRHREPLSRIFHTLSLGELAVDGFFILSGYLIVKSWERRPNLLSYIKKRVYRIYPGFVVASLISALIVGPLGTRAAAYFSQFDPFAYLVSLLFLFEPAVPATFHGLRYCHVNGSTWSIAYEFRCYLAVALFGLCGLIRNKWGWLFMTALAIGIAMVPQAIMDRANDSSAVIVFGLPGQFFRLFALFAAGGAFCLFRDGIRYETQYAVPALIITILAFFTSETTELAMATTGAYVFFWLGFKHIKGLQWHRAWPDISYGVYLYGWPCQILLLWYFRSINPFAMTPCALILTFGLAWLSWRFVESPFMARKAE
jgi:peptidoglycan/LPS O-acetylase OafA/YrhL